MTRAAAARPGRLRRSDRPRSGYLRRHPDLIRLVMVALGIGLVRGAAAFTIASSRGLDDLSAADIIALGWVALATGLAVFGIARVAMFQDLRALAILVALIAGSAVGDLAAFLTLPGTTTDGSLRLTFGNEGVERADPRTQRATCRWTEDGRSVLEVAARRPIVVSPDAPTALDVRIELSAEGETDSAATIDVLAPATRTPVLRYSAMTEPTSRDPSDRIGSVATGIVPIQRLHAPDVDPVLIDAVQALMPPLAVATVEWSCPQLP